MNFKVDNSEIEGRRPTTDFDIEMRNVTLQSVVFASNLWFPFILDESVCNDATVMVYKKVDTSF